MLTISTLEEIQSLLLRVPTLVHEFEEQTSTFVPNVKDWLATVEQVLASGHLPAAAEIASLRSTLIGAERGLIPPDLRTTKKLTPRKMKVMAGADLLRRAERAVAIAVSKDFGQLDEAQRIIQQMAAVLKRRNVLLPADSAGVASLWQQLSADETMAVPTAHVESLTGLHDALILLARALREPLAPAPA
jgi:hypothetical protein